MESAEKDSQMFGFTGNYVRIETPYDASRVNQVEDIRLEALTAAGHVRAGDPAFLSLL